MVLGIAISAFLTTTVQAQIAMPAAAQKQVKQSHRIQEGRCSGDLTRRETKQLMHQQQQIRQHKRLAKADGYVSPRERAAINRHQKAASHNIYRKKHNDRERI